MNIHLTPRNVVDPGRERGVEELPPLAADVKDEAAAEEEVLQAEGGCHAAEVEEEAVRAVVLQGDLGGRLGAKGVRGALPGLEELRRIKMSEKSGCKGNLVSD